MKSKYAEGGDVERTKDYDKIRSYSLDDIKGFFGSRKESPKEIKRETEEEREIRRETRGAVPGMGAEANQRVTTAPVQAAPIRRRRSRPPPPARPPTVEGPPARLPTVEGGGMEASRAADAPSRRTGRGRESEPQIMRILRRAVHGEEGARAIEARGYAKGGSVKKMASGGTCRGMGKATRGGNYKFR